MFRFLKQKNGQTDNYAINIVECVEQIEKTSGPVYLCVLCIWHPFSIGTGQATGQKACSGLNRGPWLLRASLLDFRLETDKGVRLTYWCCLVTKICPTLRPHGLQHTRHPCLSPTPGVYSTSCSSSQRCHPTISSFVIPFSCLPSFPASVSFPMRQLFPSGGQSIGASASFLPIIFRVDFL